MTKNEKGATQGNEISQLHKSKDWLKFVNFMSKNNNNNPLYN